MPSYDFEDGLVPSGWTQSLGSNKSWVITSSDAYAGTYCLRSDTIADSEVASIECTVACGTGNVTFYLDLECESGYDFFRFYIDGVEKLLLSGDTGWQAKSIAVTAGTRIFKWRYNKDSSGSVGRDLAAIDNLYIPPNATSVSIPAESLALTAIAPLSTPFWMPVAALDFLAQAPFFLPVLLPAAALPLIALTPAITQTANLPSVNLALTAQTPGFWNALALSNASSLSLIVQGPQWILTPPAIAPYRNLYRAYLTGVDETPPLADVELPLGSFQSTRRNGEATYLSIIVPNPVPYLDSIQARLNGDLVVMAGFAIGETETLTELIRVNFESFRYDLGPNSGSATLTGHKQVTYTNPKTVTLAGISYFSASDGIRRVRCEPAMWLMPGDTADLGDRGTFVVDELVYSINPTFASMEVAEADV